MIIRLFPFLLFIFHPFISHQALALTPSDSFDSYKEFREGQLELQLAGQYLSTDSNFNNEGSIQSLGNGRYLKMYDIDFGARLGFVENWAAYALLKSPTVHTFDGTTTRGNSSVSNLITGIETFVETQYIDFIPEFKIDFPIETVGMDQSGAFNTEGIMQIELLLNMQKNFQTWSPYGFVGYRYRAQGRSALTPWMIGANFGKENIFGAELSGYHSVFEDMDSANENKTKRLNLIDRVNGGSYLFGSLNPGAIDAKVYYRAHMSDFWMFQLEAGILPFGWNTSYHFHVGGFLRFNVELWEGAPIAKTRIKKRIQIRKDSFLQPQDKENLEQFKEDTQDGVDQKLFNSKPSQKPPPTKKETGTKLEDLDLEIEIRAYPKKR